jgi:uncharacterized protein YjbI with pentapeptide repeats
VPMTLSGLQDRDAAIEALLAVARRETLALAIAVAAVDDDAASVASARLRWAIVVARERILAAEHEPWIARHADQLDRVANRAQRWLVSEPPRTLQAVGALLDRVVARRGARPTAVDASHAHLVDLDLDGLELPRLVLRGASLTEVTLRRARCEAADATAAHWLRCDLAAATLTMAVFSGGSVGHGELSRAALAGSSWHRAAISQTRLVRAVLADARLDRAELTDCNLRGADLSIVRSPDVASLVGARFVRCDLRETCWAGRDLGGAVFIDCKLFGAHGAPAAAGVVIERADVSLAGDGSVIASQRDVVAGWRTMVGAGPARSGKPAPHGAGAT